LDTDSSLLPSALVFSAFFLLFTYLSLAEHSAAGSWIFSGRYPRGLGFTISSFKLACTIAVSVSGLALAYSLAPSLGWWYVTMLALALLVALTGVNRGAYVLAGRRPEWAAACSRPVHRLLSAVGSRRAGGTSAAAGSGSPEGVREEVHAELQEQVLAAAVVGSIDERDREMLQSILRLEGSTVREIMIPRLDIVAVDANHSLGEVAEIMGERGHSRLPVYDGHLDSIVGIVHSRDLLAVLGNGNPGASLRETVRTAFFIPESKRLDDLLEELQEKAQQMAIVVDEYGGTEGLVTMEDLLEEIVGEIEDEFSRVEDPEVVRNNDGSALVDAGVNAEEVGEMFRAKIESQEVDTVGGYVYRTLGRIPQVGDTVLVDGLRIEVVSMLGRRLRKLRIGPAVEDSVASA
jgi:CBS domain containing-hemolysin-like protein